MANQSQFASQWTSYDDGLLPMLSHLLQLSPFRLQACECLLLVVARKGALADRAPLLSLFQNLNLITSAVPSSFVRATEAHQLHPADDNYTFLKRLAQLISVVGSNQLCQLWGSQGFSAKEPPNFQGYLEVLSKFLTHKSPLVASFTMPAWQQVLRNDEAIKTSAVLDIIPDLLMAVFMMLPKPWNSASGYHDTQVQCCYWRSNKISCILITHSTQLGMHGMQVEAYCTADFDSDQDLIHFLGTFRNNALEIVRLAAHVAPRAAIAHSCDLLQQVMSQPAPDHGSTAAVTVRFYAIWEAMAAMMNHVGVGCFKLLLDGGPQLEASVHRLQGVLSNLLGMPPHEDPEALLSVISVAASFTPILSLLPTELTEGVLSLMFRILTMPDPAAALGDSGTGLSPIAKVKRKTGVMLVDMCKKPSARFLGMLDAVCRAVQEVLIDEKTTEMVRKLLLQAMIRAGNSLDSLEAHRGMIE